ncbi:unnamed protein product [Rhodiola kirilowii]
MASTYRDRTTEFRHLSDRLKKIDAAVDRDDTVPTTSHPTTSYRSEFNKKASRIGLGIHETSMKITKLAKLAKRSSMFDDPIKEIQELTALIKDDITALNVAVSDLQTLQNLQLAESNHSEDTVVHTTAICDDLKSRLMGATKQFQNVLTTRTENIKAHESRKQMFSTNLPRENPFRQPAKTVTEPPPWLSSAKPSNSQSSLVPSSSVQVGNQLRRRSAVENAPSEHAEMSMLQQVVPQQENYSQGRAVALQHVESTISELSGIFTHLATMVAQQGELAIRIDDNMEESLANVEGARSAILKHLTKISSNRWLMIKIFAILIFFLMIFLFFIA